ncbi:MAG: hypothetical protein IPK22_16725 [Verrucomicrobiaceae bacterium]|nr:hypothetical protein [Verrucomicrobiaceae bacterium]
MRRPKSILVLIALALAAVIVFWPARLPEPKKATTPPAPPPAPQLSDLGKPADLFYTPPQADQKPEIDAANHHKASLLNSPGQSIQEDLQIVAEFVDLIHKAGINASFGDNADITAALTGTQYAGQKGHLFPRQHNALRGGQLVDRWGTPFWFHANGPGKLEIRSAGPDKQLFTTDDISHNPSPPGLGVTPEQP